jgi:PAS domain-containing protein
MILTANPSCYRMLGWMERDIVGKTIEEVFMPEKFHVMHKKMVQDYVKRTVWVPSVILDKARLLSIANKVPYAITYHPSTHSLICNAFGVMCHVRWYVWCHCNGWMDRMVRLSKW